MNEWWEDWTRYGQSIGWETATFSLPSFGILPGLRYQDLLMVGLTVGEAPDPELFQRWWEAAGKPWVIWSDQWERYAVVVQSKMKHIAGESIRIPARVCQWGVISPEEYRSFLDRFHAYGFARAPLRYGLYIPEFYKRFVPPALWEGRGPMLVSVSGFSRGALWERASGPSFSMEWIRFTSHPFLHVVGGWQKMLHHVSAEHQPGDVMSYSDCAWQGNQKGLAGLGFQLEETQPFLRFRWDAGRERRILDEDGKIFNVGTEKWIKYFPPQLSS